jgi:hypothetical protein
MGEYLLPGAGAKITFTIDERAQTSELVLRPKMGQDIHAKRIANLPSSDPIRAAFDKDIFDGLHCWFQLMTIDSLPIPLLVMRDQDHLLLQETGQANIEVFPASSGGCISNNKWAWILFNRDPLGQVTEIIVYNEARRPIRGMRAGRKPRRLL